MILLKKANELRRMLESENSIGFVPTMGALHAGHLSLVERSMIENKVTVCSVFINPLQFNEKLDFEQYPVTIEKDIMLLENSGCKYLLLPTVQEIYPTGIDNLPRYELGGLETILEGKFRPGHFQGVAHVVHRLLDIVRPNRLYVGEKDFQQCMIIRKVLDITNPGGSTELVICPTVREPDGLAMSSRNARLNEEEREKARALSESLSYIKNQFRSTPFPELLRQAQNILEKNGVKPDYVEIADADNLEIVPAYADNRRLVALIAARAGDIRLIDNMPLN